ncbi:hypothetical protein CBR_g16049 [Chara braunii]|uniref:Integrator complex subunit 7 N-terminal domain-containing protein n=1 Tax=Chara braunii TaxID=69332 RepID=A0A388JT40_CHABU|nr:hypothetical protein CBR_g16049 [Chara braunii]|eukprot:GBG60927.1 hypothetical protein CBR_g16049 [Chara braunii]
MIRQQAEGPKPYGYDQGGVTGSGPGAPASPSDGTSAAAQLAVTWSVDLDRGLRSSKPGSQAEAIARVGPRLLKWNAALSGTTIGEGKASVPAPDISLVNAVILRLADAFRTGSNHTRLNILRVFMMQYREGLKEEERLRSRQSRGSKPGPVGQAGRDRVRRRYGGILAPGRLLNPAQVLKRVKAAISSSDPVARALTLRMIGCLTPVGAENLDIHRVVLGSLQSPDPLEVRAAIFTVCRFCEFSPAFARSAFAPVADLLESMTTAADIRTRAVGILGRMGLSPNIALMAHQLGERLLLKYPTTEMVISTIASLTSLAANSTVTVERQVLLLLSLIHEDPRVAVRTSALHSLCALVSKANRVAPQALCNLQPLIDVLDGRESEKEIQCAALATLTKLSKSCSMAVKLLSWEELLPLLECMVLERDWDRTEAAVRLLVSLTCVASRCGPENSSRPMEWTCTLEEPSPNEAAPDSMEVETDDPVRLGLRHAASLMNGCHTADPSCCPVRQNVQSSQHFDELFGRSAEMNGGDRANICLEDLAIRVVVVLMERSGLEVLEAVEVAIAKHVRRFASGRQAVGRRSPTGALGSEAKARVCAQVRLRAKAPVKLLWGQLLTVLCALCDDEDATHDGVCGIALLEVVDCFCGQVRSLVKRCSPKSEIGEGCMNSTSSSVSELQRTIPEEAADMATLNKAGEDRWKRKCIDEVACMEGIRILCRCMVACVGLPLPAAIATKLISDIESVVNDVDTEERTGKCDLLLRPMEEDKGNADLSKGSVACDLIAAVAPVVFAILMRSFRQDVARSARTIICDEKRKDGSAAKRRWSRRLNRAAKGLIAHKECWKAYQLGMMGAQAGMWDLALSTFESLEKKVTLDKFYLWLHALAQVAMGEKLLADHREKGNGRCGQVDDKEEKVDACEGHIHGDKMCEDKTTIGVSDTKNGEDDVLPPQASKGLANLEAALVTLSAMADGMTAPACFEYAHWLVRLRVRAVQCIFDVVSALSIFTPSLERVKGGEEGKLQDSKCGDEPHLLAARRLAANLASRLAAVAVQFDDIARSFAAIDDTSIADMARASLGCSLICFLILSVFSEIPASEIVLADTNCSSRVARRRQDVAHDSMSDQSAREKEQQHSRADIACRLQSTNAADQCTEDIGVKQARLRLAESENSLIIDEGVVFAAVDLTARLNRLEEMLCGRGKVRRTVCDANGIGGEEGAEDEEGRKESCAGIDCQPQDEILNLCYETVSEIRNADDLNAEAGSGELRHPRDKGSHKLRLLKKAIARWFQSSWHLPKAFFTLRRRTAVEMTICQARNAKLDGRLQVSVGGLLSLNVNGMIVNPPPSMLRTIKSVVVYASLLEPAWRVQVPKESLYCFPEPEEQISDNDSEVYKRLFSCLTRAKNDPKHFADEAVCRDRISAAAVRFANTYLPRAGLALRNAIVLRGKESSIRRQTTSCEGVIRCQVAPNGAFSGSVVLDLVGTPVGTYTLQFTTWGIDNYGLSWALGALNVSPTLTITGA